MEKDVERYIKEFQRPWSDKTKAPVKFRPN
jgi:hypothetical protein